MGIFHFLKEFTSDPAAIGAVAPSSDVLAAEMVRDLDLATAQTVLEYGPGTGVLTAHVVEAVPKSCRILVIERNPRFAQALHDRFPRIRIHEGSVADVRAICDEHDIGLADCIVSGLPWAAFPPEMQRTFLDAMMTVLRPGGRFATFAYLQGLLVPAGQRFASLLPEYFSEVKRSRIVWRNLPPAFVYRCRRRTCDET